MDCTMDVLKIGAPHLLVSRGMEDEGRAQQVCMTVEREHYDGQIASVWLAVSDGKRRLPPQTKW